MMYFVLAIIAYLLGSIPMSLLFSKWFGYGDIRKIGSGNIGATNAMRAGGLRLAGAVWVADMAKAAAAVLMGAHITGSISFGALCGFIAIVGHNFPVWLKFKGGKGISCTFGFMLALNPLMFIVAGIEWLLVALLTRCSSLGALAVLFVLPLLGFSMSMNIGFVCLAISLLGFFQHRANISRLLSGTESKIEWKWKK